MHPSFSRLVEVAASGQKVAAVFGDSALAQALNESPQTIYNWKRRGVSKEGAIKAAKAFGGTADFFLEGGEAPPLSRASVAHVVSYPKIETPPITTWEVVVSLEKMPAIPADLMVEAPDDALKAAGLGKGQLIWFRAASTAQPANVVLIEAEGRRYIRRYTEDGTAAPLDSAYKTFTDFRVVAVMFMRPGSSV